MAGPTHAELDAAKRLERRLAMEGYKRVVQEAQLELPAASLRDILSSKTMLSLATVVTAGVGMGLTIKEMQQAADELKSRKGT